MSAFRSWLCVLIATAGIASAACPGAAQERASGPAKELAAPPPATFPIEPQAQHMGPKNCAYWNERLGQLSATEDRISKQCVQEMNEFNRACALQGSEEALQKFLEEVYRVWENGGSYGRTPIPEGVGSTSNDPCPEFGDSNCKNCYQMWEQYGFPWGNTVVEFIVDFIRKNPGQNPFLVDWGVCHVSLSALSEPGRDVEQNPNAYSASETECYTDPIPIVSSFVPSKVKCKTKTRTRTQNTKELPSWSTSQKCWMVLDKGESFVDYLAGIAATCANAEFITRTIAYAQVQRDAACDAERQAKVDKFKPITQTIVAQPGAEPEKPRPDTAQPGTDTFKPRQETAQPGTDVVDTRKDSEPAAGIVKPQTQTGQPGVQPAAATLPLSLLLPPNDRMQIALGNFGCGAVPGSVKQCRDVCEKLASNISNALTRAFRRSECRAECDSFETQLVSLCLPALDVTNRGGPNSAAAACSARPSAVQQCRNICEKGASNVSNAVARAMYRRDCQTKCDDLDTQLVALCERNKDKPDSMTAQPGVAPASGGGRIGKKSKAKQDGNTGKSDSAGVASNNKKAVVAKKKKPLPPSPCRDGERSCVVARGQTGSPGVANNKPKNSLDQHDFSPSFVNVNPNAGRIGTRPGGGGGGAKPASGGFTGSPGVKPVLQQPAVSGGAGASAPVFIPR